MTSTLKKTDPVDPSFEVGSRVRTRHSANRDTDPSTWPMESGSIVEDFAVDPATSQVVREWAVAARWAVALDNGCLVFRDTADLESEQQSTRDQ